MNVEKNCLNVKDFAKVAVRKEDKRQIEKMYGSTEVRCNTVNRIFVVISLYLSMSRNSKNWVCVYLVMHHGFKT